MTPDDPTPFGAQTERIDTNQSARILPWFAGTRWLGLTWLGDVFNVKTTPITTNGRGKHDKRTTGYNYQASFAGVISNGPTDFILKIKFDDELVYNFENTGTLFRTDSDFYQVTIPNRGILKFYWGTESQPINTLLANSGQEHSAYRGQFYVIGKDIFTGAADKTNMPNIQLQAQRFPMPSWLPASEKFSNGLDANPVGILWEWWTDHRFGLGRPESELDIPRLQAVSTRLYNEFNFVSPFFDTQTDLKSALIKMFEHFDAYPTSYGGKFGFELVRPVTVNIPLLTKADLIDDPSIRNQTWSDTFDEVRVKYQDWQLDGSNNDNMEKHHELANFAITGRHRAQELDRPWTIRQFQAAMIAASAARVAGQPQASGSLKVRESSSSNLAVGSVFNLQTRDGSTLQMRVDGRTEPDPDKRDVSLSFVSDTGWANANFYIGGQDAIGESSVFAPEKAFAIGLLDAPYQFSDPKFASLMFMVARADGYSTSYDVHKAANVDGPYQAASGLQDGERFFNFSTRARLTADYSASTLPIDDVVGITFEVESPDLAPLEIELDLDDALDHTLLAFMGDSVNEIMSLFNLVKTGATTYTAKVVRGLYDSRRRTHADGTEFWLQMRLSVDHLAWTPYSPLRRFYKIQPFFGNSGVDLSTIDVTEHSENGRSLWPIAPQNVRFNGDNSHAIWDNTNPDNQVITWSNTSRARTVFGLPLNEAPATDLTAVRIEIWKYDGSSKVLTSDTTPNEELQMLPAVLISAINADFQLRVYGIRDGWLSMDYTSCLVRKI